MRKLKYGLLLILSMILFSVPTLAAKTYYLPSKVVYGSGDEYDTFSYDKYGHVIKYHSIEEEEGGTVTWKFKYDKNGKRISGEQYFNGKLSSKLTFDKNDHLKTEKYVSGDGETVKFKWNSKGYYEGDNRPFSITYKYSYYKNGNIKKRASFYNGELDGVAYFDRSGLRSKNPPVRGDYKYTYEYVFDKNGLVKTKIITSKDMSGHGVSGKTKVTFYYSKTKTDAKTYYQFIDEWDSCRNNSNL